jgi:hypothetical protein
MAIDLSRASSGLTTPMNGKLGLSKKTAGEILHFLVRKPSRLLAKQRFNVRQLQRANR